VIRKGDELRVGPIRIPVLSNIDGRCSVLAIYGTSSTLGTSGTIDEDVLEKLAKEDGVIMNSATRKSDK
jgi:hypothetical protein